MYVVSCLPLLGTYFYTVSEDTPQGPPAEGFEARWCSNVFHVFARLHVPDLISVVQLCGTPAGTAAICWVFY